MKSRARRATLVIVILTLAALALVASKPSTRTVAEAANVGLQQAAPLRHTDWPRLVENYSKLSLSFEANQGRPKRQVPLARERLHILPRCR